jgi:hypothetical protein
MVTSFEVKREPGVAESVNSMVGPELAGCLFELRFLNLLKIREAPSPDVPEIFKLFLQTINLTPQLMEGQALAAKENFVFVVMAAGQDRRAQVHASVGFD